MIKLNLVIFIALILHLAVNNTPFVVVGRMDII
mgnify:CR=1 FL=1